MTFYEKYLIKCKAKGVSPSAAAVAAGLTKTSVTRWKNGSKPTDANVLLLAEYFGCPIDDLTDDIKKAPVKIDERRIEDEKKLTMLVSLFERLSPEDQNDVIFELLQKAHSQLDQDDQK